MNVRYTFKEEQREFTALITATACDYYLDDRTRQRLRGDTVPAQFQEFWTFQFHNKTWLLREVEQTRESEALKAENFFEQFTDTGVEQIYGKEAAKEGQAGPWLEKGGARPRRRTSSGCSTSSSRRTRFGTVRRCWKPPAGYSWR